MKKKDKNSTGVSRYNSFILTFSQHGTRTILWKKDTPRDDILCWTDNKQGRVCRSAIL